MVRRPRARVRLRDRLRAAGRAGVRRLGAVLALPRARAVRRAAGPPAAVRRRRADPGHPLPRDRRPAAGHCRRGLPVPRHRRGTRAGHPPRQLAQLRAARLAAGRARTGGARRCPAGCLRTAPGLATGERAAGQPAHRQRRRPPAAARARAARAPAAAVRRRHREAVLAHGSGLRRRLSAESRGSFAQRSGNSPKRTASNSSAWAARRQRTQVTRSCAPSGRAASR